MAAYRKRGNRFWVEYRQDGKRIRRPLKTIDGRPVKDEKLARYLTNEIENSLSRGDILVTPSDTPILKALGEYQQHCRIIKKENTIANDFGALRGFIAKEGIVILNQITEARVRAYLDKRINDKEIGHLTANHLRGYISAFLNFCKKQRYITANPLAGMPRYRVAVTPPIYLSTTKVRAILTSAREETLYPAIMTAIYTGMRLGELKRLKWSDIDTENNIITIRQSKSGKFRNIPIRGELESVLMPKNLPFDFTNSRRIFKRIIKRAGIGEIGWHTFRHTFITLMVKDSKDLAAVQKVAGHADIRTTMGYTHVSLDHAREAISQVKFVT